METVINLPKRALIDGLFGLLLFFFSSATEGEKKQYESVNQTSSPTSNSQLNHCSYKNTSYSIFYVKDVDFLIAFNEIQLHKTFSFFSLYFVISVCITF